MCPAPHKCPGAATALTNRTTPTQHDTAAFGTAFTQRGNVRCEVRQKSSGNYLITEHEYDILGNIVKTKLPENRVDSNGHIVEFEYTGSTFAFATKIKRKVNANKTLETSVTWDYQIGRPTGITPPNGQLTSYSYDDELDRLYSITPPASAGSATTFDYDDTNLTVTSSQAQDSCSVSNNMIERRTTYDSLGRMKATAVKEPGGNWITTNHGYDSRGRQNRVSHPHLTSDGANESSALWTTTTIDALGRVTRVQTPDTAATTYEPNNDKTLVTDPASKKQCVVRDGFGRIYEIWENTTSCATRPTDLKLITTYGYDQLDRLTSVTQSPLSARIFGYDNAGRLTSATNPEKSVGYDYDNNGNLKSRTSGSHSVSYSYDGVNRVKEKRYNNVLFAAFCYDGESTTGSCASAPTGSANLNGYLTMVRSPASLTKYSVYDEMGRVKTSVQETTGLGVSTFQYTYNKAGGLEQETYPSQRQTTTCYDRAARISSIKKGGPAATSTYVTVNSYAAHGAPSQMTLGNSVVENWTYDSNRLQVTQVRASLGSNDLMKLELCYTGANPTSCPATPSVNNGNLLGQKVTRGSTVWNNSYGYDAYNRVSSWSQTGGTSFSQTYCMDERGNRALVAGSWIPAGESAATPTVSACNATNLTAMFTNNRWSAVTHDAGGNQTQNGAGMTMTYDAEDRLLTSTRTIASTTQTTNYVYDGEGRRVRKFTTVATPAPQIVESHVYLYDAGGSMVADYAEGGPGTPGTRYLTADHLGSTRLEMDASGGVLRAMDYAPFGSELPVATAGEVVRFTGKERDVESGLDYFGARYMSSAQSRFTSPDRPFVDQHPEDPQSWNMYAYVRNNPLGFVDDDGRQTRRPVPGASGYTYRGDLTNPADNPNFHIFNRKGIEIGRISLQEGLTGRVLDSGNQETALRMITQEYSGYAVPNAVREGIEGIVQQRGIQPRFAVGGGPFRGFTVRGVGMVSMLSIFTGALADYHQAQATGLFTNIFGENKIVDATKAAEALGAGTIIQYTDKSGKSQFYTVSNGQFVRGGCNQKRENCGISNPSEGSFTVVDLQ